VQYLGGKFRIAKTIVPIMESFRTPGSVWVEPFMGSCNTLALASGDRIGNDIDYELVSLYQKCTNEGYQPPENVDKDFYLKVKENPLDYPPELRAFISIGCSFAGLKWGTFASNKKGESYSQQARNSLSRKSKLLKGTKFYSKSYQDLDIPPKSIIYCDPPYEGSAGYTVSFDSVKFWNWAVNKSLEGHIVWVSEYSCPLDIEPHWSLSTVSTLAQYKQKKVIEKLYLLTPGAEFQLSSY